MNNYVLLFGFSVFLSSISQVILKKSALQKHDSNIKEYLNPRVIVAYGLFLLCTIITVFAYRKVKLSFGAVLEATSYIYITVFSYFFFKEKISPKIVIGYCLIIAGIVIFSV